MDLTEITTGLAKSAVLGGTVWTFFGRVEAVLKDQTKHEIARWLRFRNFETGLLVEENWPATFAKVFDRVFGEKHLSWKCFGRSCVATLASCLMCFAIAIKDIDRIGDVRLVWQMAIVAIAMSTLGLFIFDYVSLLETRYLLSLMKRLESFTSIASLLIVDLILTGVTGVAPSLAIAGPRMFSNALHDWSVLRHAKTSPKPERTSEIMAHIHYLQGQLIPGSKDFPIVSAKIKAEFEELSISDAARDRAGLAIFWLPTFFTSVWLWLYVASGLLLKFARRFDKFFLWFNAKADIEQKPLQAIGLVAGGIVALLYWAWAVVSTVI